MSGLARWRLAFLGLTALVIGMEVWASVDGDPDTRPWTDEIVSAIPAEVAFAGIGALMLWVPLHFAIRYWRRHRERED